MNLKLYLFKRQAQLYFYFFCYVTATVAIVFATAHISMLLWHNLVIKYVLLFLPLVLVIKMILVMRSDGTVLPYMMETPKESAINGHYKRLKEEFFSVLVNFHLKKTVEIQSFMAPLGSKEYDMNRNIFSFENSTHSYIIVPQAMLYKDLDTLLGISFHELGHILCSHSGFNVFSSIFFAICGLYSVILVILLGIYLHSLAVTILLFYLGPYLAQVGFTAMQRQQEYTADGVSTIFGYAENLINDLLRYRPLGKDNILVNKFRGLTQSHPSDQKRIAYIRSLF